MSNEIKFTKEFDTLVRMHRDNPEEYKEYMEHYSEVAKDMAEIAIKIAADLQNRVEEILNA